MRKTSLTLAVSLLFGPSVLPQATKAPFLPRSASVAAGTMA